MNNIHSLEFILENCESIIVPIMYIDDIHIRNIHECVYFEHIPGQISERNIKVANWVRITIFDIFKNDKTLQPSLYTDKYNGFYILEKAQNISHIIIHYNDYTTTEYSVIWYTATSNNHISEINQYQRAEYNKHDKTLTISINPENLHATSNI